MGIFKQYITKTKIGSVFICLLMKYLNHICLGFYRVSVDLIGMHFSFAVSFAVSFAAVIFQWSPLLKGNSTYFSN